MDHSSKHKKVQNATIDNQFLKKVFKLNVITIKEPFYQQVRDVSYQERHKNSSLEQPTDKFVGHLLSKISFSHKLLATFTTNLLKRRYDLISE